VPLSSFQSRILGLLAAHRNPESFVAGAAPLARDVFHDSEAVMRADEVVPDKADHFLRAMPAGMEDDPWRSLNKSCGQ
jgi:hypothetical protein